MLNVTAATSFFGNEGMWRAGETKAVSAHRANELIEQGLVIESSDQASPLQQAADALGATVGSPAGADSVQQVADALGAMVKTADEPVTHESLKKKKPKPGPSEAKPASGPAETK